MDTPVSCAFCPQPLNYKDYGNYSKRLGWVKHRTAGGFNAMALQSSPLAYCHGSCMDEQVYDLTKKLGGVRTTGEAPDIECYFCGEQIGGDERGFFSRRIGWVLKRRGAGTNRINLLSEPLGWAHSDCVGKQKTEGDIGWAQESLDFGV